VVELGSSSAAESDAIKLGWHYFNEAVHRKKKAQRDLQSKRVQRDDLCARLTAAKQLVAERRAETSRLAVTGANDAELDAAEAANRAAQDRFNTLTVALAQIELELTVLEEEAVEQAEQRKRADAAAEVERLADEIAEIAPTFDDAIARLASVTGTAGAIIFEAKQISGFADSVRGELAKALQAIGPLLRSHARHVLSGHAALPETKTEENIDVGRN